MNTHIMYTYTSYCLLFRDNRETMKELTDKERSEIQEAEEARSVNIMYMYYCIAEILDGVKFGELLNFGD